MLLNEKQQKNYKIMFFFFRGGGGAVKVTSERVGPKDLGSGLG